MPTAPPTVAVARHAMATRFEIVLHGANATSLRAAGEEALNEIARLEDQLSLYRPTSEIARVNACAHLKPVRVSPELFALLQQARQLHRETNGAFDITIGPLMRCWSFLGGSGALPEPAALAEARTTVGMDLVQLDTLTVRFARPGVMLDLGAIGKGYAIERAAELLREAGVTSAILHGGTSTVFAIGRPLNADGWKVAVDVNADLERRSPTLRNDYVGVQASACSPDRLKPELRRAGPVSPIIIPLRDEALSVSAVWGKSFQSGSKTLGHVLDPRTGEPADRAVLAVVVTRSATESDALSTALLTDGPEAVECIAALRPGTSTLAVQRTNGPMKVAAQGIKHLLIGGAEEI